MPPVRFALTDKTIFALPFATSGQQLVRDAELPGFFVLVGKKRKTFMVQGDLRTGGKRESIRVKIGEVGDINTREARAKAKTLLGSIANGTDPRVASTDRDSEEVVSVSASPSGPTLRYAWTRYRESHLARKNRSEGTIANFRDHVERLLADWLDEPLSKFGCNPDLVAQRHETITRENGPYIANGCMRSFRAIYNHARKTARSLPAENPVLAVDWNAEKRRNTALGLSDLSSWFIALSALENPIRREFHLFSLLSGSRPGALKYIRIGDIHLLRRTLHISRPKGGEAKAFDIPLSGAMSRCLIRTMRFGRALYPSESRKWLFPADTVSGHIAEHREDRTKLSKWGNDLRQTYRTIAQAAGVVELDTHLLMNHSVGGVNAGYITRHKLLSDHLWRQQDLISRKATDAICRANAADSSVAKWLFLPSRMVVSDFLRATDARRAAHRSPPAAPSASPPTKSARYGQASDQHFIKNDDRQNELRSGCDCRNTDVQEMI